MANGRHLGNQVGTCTKSMKSKEAYLEMMKDAGKKTTEAKASGSSVSVSVWDDQETDIEIIAEFDKLTGEMVDFYVQKL